MSENTLQIYETSEITAEWYGVLFNNAKLYTYIHAHKLERAWGTTYQKEILSRNPILISIYELHSIDWNKYYDLH